MLIEKRKRDFSNGTVYALLTEDGYPLEVTDTFLPDYTKMAVNENTNALHERELGSRKQMDDRSKLYEWMSCRM